MLRAATKLHGQREAFDVSWGNKMKVRRFCHLFFKQVFRSSSVVEQRVEQLATKSLDGTISQAEAKELEELAPLYHQCPICGGAFLSSDFDSNGGHCSQCETPLTWHCIEIRGHQFNEIIANVPCEVEVFGQLCYSFTAPGTKYCTQCGITYPKLYSCCPGLINAAIHFHQTDEPKYGSQVISFIDTHSDTLCNMLRGRFKLNPRSRRHFAGRILPQLQRADEITRILKNTIP
jgi:hypothetical protein